MKLKRILGTLSMAVILLVGFTACHDDDNNVSTLPRIENIEVGHDNSKIGYAGSDLHLEAEIFADNKIENIQVTIHPASHDEEGWEFNQTWTEGYQDAKNATFHQHIDIPGDATPGEYHVHFYVTDQAGNTVKEEVEDLKVMEDPNAPSWEEVEVEYEGGGILHFEGLLSVPSKLDRITVEVHKNDGAYKEEFDFDPEDFDQSKAENGNLGYTIHQHINIKGAPKGDYHIHVEFEGSDLAEDEVFGGAFTVD